MKRKKIIIQTPKIKCFTLKTSSTKQQSQKQLDINDGGYTWVG